METWVRRGNGVTSMISSKNIIRSNNGLKNRIKHVEERAEADRNRRVRAGEQGKHDEGWGYG